MIYNKSISVCLCVENGIRLLEKQYYKTFNYNNINRHLDVNLIATFKTLLVLCVHKNVENNVDGKTE